MCPRCGWYCKMNSCLSNSYHVPLMNMWAGKWLNANVSCHLMEANWLLANMLFDLEIWRPSGFSLSVVFLSCCSIRKWRKWTDYLINSSTTFKLPILGMTAEEKWPPCGLLHQMKTILDKLGVIFPEIQSHSLEVNVATCTLKMA